jgi:hypothetical protein
MSAKSKYHLCAWCKKVALSPEGEIPIKTLGMKVSDFLSHGICKACAAELRKELKPPVKNPPAWAVDRSLWRKSEGIINQDYQGKKRPRNYWAVVADLYKKLGGRVERKARGNPSDAEWNQVVHLLEGFKGFPPTEVVDVEVPSRVMPKILAKLGDLEAVTYVSNKEDGVKRSYIHFFKKRPILAADSKGGQLYIVGGNYKVKPEGIVG